MNTEPEITTALELLPNQIINGNCILFAGPGVSIPAGDRLGPPGPSLLALELATLLGSQFEDYSLPWIAQAYADRNGSNALHQLIVNRLDSVDYLPNEIHYLIAHLPFTKIVYAYFDSLLQQAYKNSSVAFTHILPGGALSYRSPHNLYQPFGIVTNPDTLSVTEDELRQLFEEHNRLTDLLRQNLIENNSLFIGFNPADPTFRNFYNTLRPEFNAQDPRARLVYPGAIRDDDRKYWHDRNANILKTDTYSFLKELANELIKLDHNITLPVGFVELPRISEKERSHRENIILWFSQQTGLGRAVESGSQLLPMANALAMMKQALLERKHEVETVVGENYVQPENVETSAHILLQEGNVAWADANMDEAISKFKSAIQRDPELIDTYVSLHNLLIEMGNLEEAKYVYQQVVDRKPDFAFFPPRYKVESVLGQIDVGVTYCCYDEVRQQQVAVTVLRRALAHQPKALKNYQEVAKSLRDLTNDIHIARYLELESYHARYTYIVCEYIPGQTLQERLRKLQEGELLPDNEIIQIANQVALALQAGHRAGTPHLDLRPDNIVLSEKGAFLVNYGYSRLASGLRASFKYSAGPRSDYDAPEQKAGEIGDERSDIYALGTIMYQMLTGRMPGSGEYVTCSEIRPQLGEGLDTIIDHARAFDPKHRFRTVEETRLELHRFFLSTDYRKLNQYIRIALTRLSDLYARGLSRPGSFISLGLVIALVAAGLINWPNPTFIYMVARITSLLIINSLLFSILGYFMVRELARARGLGSLIRNGYGFGASLGFVATTFLIRTTHWDKAIDITHISGGDFVSYILACVGIGFLVTGVALALIHFIGWLLDKIWHHYTLGFYASYLILCTLIILLTVLLPPPYSLHYGE